MTVRFSYPITDSRFRGSFCPVAATEGESFEWRSGFAMMGPDGVRIHGDTPNSGEKADTASGFVTGSCPDWAGEVRELRAWKESAMSVLAEWYQVWESLEKPGRLGDSIAVASKKEIERRKWPERAGQ